MTRWIPPRFPPRRTRPPPKYPTEGRPALAASSSLPSMCRPRAGQLRRHLPSDRGPGRGGNPVALPPRLTNRFTAGLWVVPGETSTNPGSPACLPACRPACYCTSSSAPVTRRCRTGFFNWRPDIRGRFKKTVRFEYPPTPLLARCRQPSGLTPVKSPGRS